MSGQAWRVLLILLRGHWCCCCTTILHLTKLLGKYLDISTLISKKISSIYIDADILANMSWQHASSCKQLYVYMYILLDCVAGWGLMSLCESMSVLLSIGLALHRHRLDCGLSWQHYLPHDCPTLSR